MVGTPWSECVANAMKSLGDEFSANELAYLALTSKVELPVRDRLAYSLHRQFGNIDRAIIAREWQRVDLAILVEQKPKLLLEVKAMYDFDILKRNGKMLDSVRKDLRELQHQYPERESEKMLLILATGVDGSPNASMDKIIKYSSNLRKHHTASRTENEIQDAATAFFGEFEHFSSGQTCGGQAFGMKVAVRYWLFGPY